jgi:two-component system OmpR family sensor kinase
MRRLRGSLPSGLRWRLTAWVAAVMMITFGLVFAVVYVNTGTQIRSQIDSDIAGDAAQLEQAVATLAGQTPKQIADATNRYVTAQPFSGASTILFVLVPGQRTVSNHPEVFGSARPEDGETSAEQAREDLTGQNLRRPRLGYSDRRVPDVGKVRVLERAVRVGRVPVVVGSGEPLSLVERAQHGVARAFLLAAGIALALALIASYLAGARVTAPLRRMASVATRVDAGELEPRMAPPAGSGTEVRVLAESFNHMLDRLSEAFELQREFVADASHELRTPLTVIRGQLEVLAAQENPSGEEIRRVERLVQSEITRISRLVDDLLTLAQSEQTDFLRPEPIALTSYVDELWDGVSLTANRRFELGPVPEGTLAADPDRLAQALRNLARNAIEHTAEGTGLVRLEVVRGSSDGIRFTVVDDGPGIPVAERERIFERFHRTDPARTRLAGGAGLGLAIVRAIAEAHGGTVRAQDPENGRGACVELVLPGFRAAAPAAQPAPSRRRASVPSGGQT